MTKSINIFTGAEKGFLASNLKNQIKGINYDYGDVLLYKEYNHINKIFHFAGPSDDFDFKDSNRVVCNYKWYN